MRTTIVIPTYNERENLRPLVERIAALYIADCTILIVDDNSPDGTGELAEELARMYPVHVLHRPKKEGLGAAYVAGFQCAISDGADIIIQMDADGSHDPAEIPRMITALNSGSLRGRSRPCPSVVPQNEGGSNLTPCTSATDEIASSPRAPRNDLKMECDTALIIGSRRVPGGHTVGWGWHRRAMSASAQWFARHLLGLLTHDITSGFRAWSAQALRDMLGAKFEVRSSKLETNSNFEFQNLGFVSDFGFRISDFPSGYAFQEEMLYRAERTGLRIIEHPITFRDRECGISKLGWRDVFGFFQTCIRLWWKNEKISTDAHGRDPSSLPTPRDDGGDRAIVTWKTLPRPERRFALGVSIALVLLTGLPILFGWWNTPPGYTFTGLTGLTAGDQHVYYNYIEQARDGAFVVRDLYTSEQPFGRMIQLPWYAIGLLARVTGWSAPLVFHVARLLLIIPFIAFLAVFVATFLRQPIAGISTHRLRRLALLLAAFGSGIGAFFGTAILPSVIDRRGWSNWPLDLWVPEAFPFLSILRSPHFIISTWLLLAAYLFTVRADTTRRARWTISAMLAAGALVAFHPFYIPSILAIITAHAIVRMIIARCWLPHLVLHTIAVGLTMLPAAMYWGLLTLLDPIHAIRAAQNILWTGAWYAFVIGYGCFLVAGTVGAFTLRRQLRDPVVSFLFVWIAVTLALLVIPIPWQRRFTQGLSVAFAIFSAVGIASIAATLRARIPDRWREIVLWKPTIISFLVVGFGFTSILNIARDVVLYGMRFPTEPKHIFYIPTATLDAMRWLRAHSPQDAVILAPGIEANFLPGWAARPVYAGHNIETAYAENKVRAFEAFLELTTSVDAQRTFLARARISYIFVPTASPHTDRLTAIARALALPRVFTNDAVAIYRVE